jgi:hypothetical protein
MHSTDILHIKTRGGDIPTSWKGGDTFFKKAQFIASVAWAAVKDRADPELTACDSTHQQNLVGEVESQMNGNQPSGSPFSLRVADLINQLAKEDLRK